MMEIYAIGLPWNYAPRVLYFKNKEKAESVLKALQQENRVGGSSSRLFEISTIEVFEDEDIEVLKD